MAVKTKSPKVTKAPSKKKAAPPPKPVEEEESSEEESSEEEEAVPAKQAKVQPEESEEDSDDSDEEEDEEAENGAAEEESDDDDDDDEDEEESDEEEEAANGNGVANEEESSEEESDEEMEEDESDEESEEETKPTKRKAAATKEPVKKKAKKEDDDEDESEDEESEEEEESEENSDSGEPQTFFIGSLPYDWEESDLADFLKKKQIKPSRCAKRGGKPFAHVDVASSDTAKLLKLNGTEVQGSNIRVDVAGGQSSKSDSNDRFGEERKRTVFVRNLDFNLTESDIRDHFAGCEGVTMPLRDDGRAKGFAFVVYPDEAAANKAIEELNESALGERNVSCSKASDRPQQGGQRGGQRGGGRGRGDFGGRGRGGNRGRGAPSKKLFIKNLSFNITSESLAGYFEGATNVHVVTDRETGQSKGFAFVEFDSVENAQEAHKGASGAEIEGRTIFVDYAQDRDRSERGGRGGRGGGRGGPRGGGFRGRGRGRGAIVEGQGKKTTFDD